MKWFKKPEKGPVISPHFQNFDLENPTEQNLKIGQNPWMDGKNTVLNQNKTRRDYSPQFLRLESRFYILKIILLTFGVLASVVSLAFVGWAYATHQSYIHPSYFAPGTIAGFIFLVALIFVGIRAIFWFKEIHQLKINANPGLMKNSIQEIYGRLATSFININWLAAFIYLMLGFAVIITFIVFYFMGVNNVLQNTTNIRPTFGSLTYGSPGNVDYHTPGIVIWIIVGIAAFTLLNQISWQIFNLIRMKQIEHFWQEPVLDLDTLRKMKTHANWRDLILFLIGTVILAILAWLIYRTLKRKK